MNDQLIRLRCLELANDYSHNMGELINNAEILENFIDGESFADDDLRNDESCCDEFCTDESSDDGVEVPAEIQEAMSALVDKLKSKGAKGTVTLQRIDL